MYLDILRSNYRHLSGCFQSFFLVFLWRSTDLCGVDVSTSVFQCVSRFSLIVINVACHLAIAPIVLFLGHRYSTKDYLYDGAFWQPFLDDGTLSHLFTAFSRDQPQKRYVQHLIEEQGALLYRLLTQENALLLLAGCVNTMPYFYVH